jgi:hypothetical protein
MADEIDELLRGSNTAASPARRALCAAVALAAVLPVAALFVSVFVVDIARSRLTIAAAVAAAALALSVAYVQLALARGAAIRAAPGSAPPTRAAFKGSKDAYAVALARHDAAIDTAALSHSVYYNNAIFLVAAPFVGCYVFAGKVSGDLNFLLSAAAAAALAIFNSNSAVKAMSQ